MKNLIAISSSILLVFALGACGGGDSDPRPIWDIDANGISTLNTGSLAASLNTIAPSYISQDLYDSIINSPIETR